MRWTFRQSRQRDKNLEDEIAFDLAADIEERVRAGVSREEAIQASRRDLGNTALLMEDVRETWGWVAFDRFGQDIRYGWRALWKNPLFAAMAVLSLALGIGSATAIYSVMDAMLFRALPVRHPRELVILNWRAIKPPSSGFTQPAGIDSVDGSVYTGPAGDRFSPDFPWPFYDSIRGGNDVFSTVFAYKDAGQLTVSVQGQAELGGVQFVSGNFFDSLGINPAIGRLIYDSDNPADAPAVAVLSYNYWRDRFAADMTAVGRTIRIGRLPFTICGVAAPEFFGLAPGSSPRPLYTHRDTAARERGQRRHARRKDLNVLGSPLLLGRYDGPPASGCHAGPRRGGDRDAIPSVRDRLRSQRESRRSAVVVA